MSSDFEIRSERFNPEHMGPLIAKIQGKVIEVSNASDTGFSFSDQTPLSEGSVIDDLSISYKFGEEIYRGPVKIVWQKKVDHESYSHGVFLMSGPLSEHLLNAMKAASAMRQELICERENFSLLPSEFILWVSEVKSFLADLKSRVDAMENTTQILSNPGTQAYSKAVDVVLAPYVVPLLLEYGKKLNTIVEPLKNQPTYKLAKIYFRKELHKFFRCAPFVERAWLKPLGYAGDFEMMNQIYRNNTEGSSFFAGLMHKWGINEPSSCSVRARRHYFKNRLMSLLQHQPNPDPEKVLHIASIACGPAKEIIDLIEELSPQDIGRFHFYLIDQDKDALLNVKRHVTESSLKHNTKPKISYIPLAVSQIVEGDQIAESLKKKKFDFIYSVGLFDYLKQSFAKLLLSDLLEWIKPNGHLIIGNFNYSNPSHAIGDFAGDWSLVLRSEKEMVDLAENESFQEIKIFKDDLGIELFLDIRK